MRSNTGGSQTRHVLSAIQNISDEASRARQLHTLAKSLPKPLVREFARAASLLRDEGNYTYAMSPLSTSSTSREAEHAKYDTYAADLVGLGSDTELTEKLRTHVRDQKKLNERQYYLREQIKAIYKELGEAPDDVDEASILENLRGK